MPEAHKLPMPRPVPVLVGRRAEHNAKRGKPMAKCFFTLTRQEWRRLYAAGQEGPT